VLTGRSPLGLRTLARYRAPTSLELPHSISTSFIRHTNIDRWQLLSLPSCDSFSSASLDPDDLTGYESAGRRRCVTKLGLSLNTASARSTNSRSYIPTRTRHTLSRRHITASRLPDPTGSHFRLHARCANHNVERHEWRADAGENHRRKEGSGRPERPDQAQEG